MAPIDVGTGPHSGTAGCGDPRVLLTSWAAFRHGEATAGDVLAVSRIDAALTAQGVPHDVCWSPGFRPGALSFDDVDPGRYTHVVFICGPVAGRQLEWLHRRFAHCRRIAVGVSVPDPHDPAVTGFDSVLPRDVTMTAADRPPRVDLAFSASTAEVPVVAWIRAPGQAEYGKRGRHEEVHEAIEGALRERTCAVLEFDTRLGPDAQFRDPDQFCSAIRRVDAVVTTRLHGLVLGLRAGVPVVAVDPVCHGAGSEASGPRCHGAKVTAQARALHWPALISAETRQQQGSEFDRWFAWCLSAEGRAAARAVAARAPTDQADELVGEVLRTGARV
ncbi:polysaccharide pyruvyl transferase family protein [Gordonia sp. DT30]|uniref:polysaccharide pyruvyl transferase family protein n=1 Tax=unclassified Gordonia (in: high G+C Gram-positive bacteria) TaxID=2657482 RepID=UPI003CF7CF43